MQIEFSKRAVDEFAFFSRNKPKIAEKIEALITDIMRDPYRGIGKPEALKYDYSGCWARRISKEDRLVYRIDKGVLYIIQCRYHYTTS